MPSPTKSVLAWTLFSISILGSAAKSCEMTQVNSIRFQRTTSGYEDFEIGTPGSTLRSYTHFCRPLGPDMPANFLTFGAAVNGKKGANLWKSHMAIFGEDCELLDIRDFPKDKGCEEWTIDGSNYMDHKFTVYQLDRIGDDIFFHFQYGDGLYADRSGDEETYGGKNRCGCTLVQEDPGDVEMEPGISSDITRQKACRCPFSKDGNEARA